MNLWMADLAPEAPAPPPVVRAEPAPGGAEPPGRFAPPTDSTAFRLPPDVEVHQLTNFTSAAYDPFWADDSTLVFTSFEDFRFTVRAFDADSAAARPRQSLAVAAPPPGDPWTYPRYTTDEEAQAARPYRKRYGLDIAAGSFSTATTGDYNAGGAVVAFSDLLGNDRIFVSAYSASPGGRSFLEGLNVSVTRVHVGRRANVGYGVFRRAGPLFDRGDPDQAEGIPSYQQIHGGLGLVSYPISAFRRIDLSSSLGYSAKELLAFDDDGFRAPDTLRTLSFSNGMALVHDNALYGLFGPIDGWRGNVGVAYTTDLLNSALSYYTVSADVRHYARLSRDVTFASWGLARANVGRRARYNLLGGSWSARGFPLLRIRAEQLLFTSQELRFPIVKAPYLLAPALGVLGVAGLNGAAFVDAGYATNGDGSPPDLYNSGTQTLGHAFGSVGTGARLNLFGAFVLRYDIGWRFRDGFDWDEREPFSQFFFGWDF